MWDNTNQTATVPTKSGDVVITLGSSTIKTPSGEVLMDTSAMAKDSRTYIPLRYALEALGFKVDWAGGTTADTVSITGDIGAASSRVPMTATEVSALASPAVFYIEVAGQNGVTFASGSGFFIDPSCVGVTNYHVIEGAYSAKITGVDGTTYNMGMVLYYDKERDIAVFDAIPVNNSGIYGHAPYLNLATTSSIHNGDVVYAIGSPLGLQNSITDGLVSNKDRVLPGVTKSYIQTSAPISHGNSGGPLLNQYGEVVGINTASLTDGQNLNLAVPVSVLANVEYNDNGKWMLLSQVAGLETGETTEIAYYPDAWWCPDFGAFCGLSPTYSNNNGEGAIYYYNIPSFDCVKDYFLMLEADGFVYNTDMAKEMSDEDNQRMCFTKYGSKAYSAVFWVDGETGEFAVFFLAN